MKLLPLGAIALAIPVCVLAVEHSDTYQKTFPLGGADGKLEVAIINGSVVVTGDNGNDVRVTVRERWRADSQADLDDARREIQLKIEQIGNTVRVYLDTPKNQRRERRNLHFNHDVEVQIPRDIALDLKTINGGEVRAERVRGEFHLKNINGKVKLIDAAGFGELETLNGGVHATFVENPAKPSRFKSLNGTVDVAFQANLSADLRMKSMNGDGYTDFEFTSVAAASRSTNRVVRVGAGGVEHNFETLNGNIKITKYGK